MSLTRRDLDNQVAVRTGSTATDAHKMIGALLDIVVENVASGEEVGFVGFGKFTARTRQPRKGRNPKTGEEMDIPAVTVPVFKPGKSFKEALSV